MAEFNVGDRFWDENRFKAGLQPNGQITDIITAREYVIVKFFDDQVAHYEFSIFEDIQPYPGKAGMLWQLYAE